MYGAPQWAPGRFRKPRGRPLRATVVDDALIRGPGAAINKKLGKSMRDHPAIRRGRVYDAWNLREGPTTGSDSRQWQTCYASNAMPWRCIAIERTLEREGGAWVVAPSKKRKVEMAWLIMTVLCGSSAAGWLCRGRWWCSNWSPSHGAPVSATLDVSTL